MRDYCQHGEPMDEHCPQCAGHTKAAANDSATAPVPAGGTPEGLAREKVEMTDSEVKPSSPTTEAGREAWKEGLERKHILAIEQQAREGIELLQAEARTLKSLELPSSPVVCKHEWQVVNPCPECGLDACLPTEPCHPWEPHPECAYANGPNDSRSFEPWRCYRVGAASESGQRRYRQGATLMIRLTRKRLEALVEAAEFRLAGEIEDVDYKPADLEAAVEWLHQRLARSEYAHLRAASPLNEVER